jgi:hypothetical protein
MRAALTRRGFLGMAVTLPLVLLAVAAALRAAGGVETSSVVRGMVAYSGVAAWGWRVVSRLPPPEGRRQLWYGPLLYVALSLAVLAIIAVTQERGVAALSAQWRVLLLRSGVQLGLGYAYVALVQWTAATLGGPDDPSTEPRVSP